MKMTQKTITRTAQCREKNTGPERRNLGSSPLCHLLVVSLSFFIHEMEINDLPWRSLSVFNWFK